MKKIIAGGLTAVLIFLSPGLPCYQAFAGTLGSGEGDAHLPTGSGATEGLHWQGKIPVAGIVPGANGLEPGVANGFPGASAPAAPELAPAAPESVLPVADGSSPSLSVSASREFPTVQGVADAGDPKVLAEGDPGKSSPAPSQGRSHPTPSRMGFWRGFIGGGRGRELTDPRADRRSFLNDLFDRMRRRKDGSPPVGVSAAARSAPRANGLSASTASSGDRRQVVPSLPTTKTKKSGVFDLSVYTPTQRNILVARLTVSVGLAILMPAMPMLVTAWVGPALAPAVFGAQWMTHYWTFAAASLFAGEVIKRSTTRGALIATASSRAGLYATISILAMALGSAMPRPLFLALVGFNAAVVAHQHLTDMDSSGAAKYFPDNKIREKALYQYKFFKNLAYVTVPPLFGLFADALDRHYSVMGLGAEIGLVLAAACFAVSAWKNYRWTRLAHDHEKVGGVDQEDSTGLRDRLSAAWSILAGTPKRFARAFRALKSDKAAYARFWTAIWEVFHEYSREDVALPLLATTVWAGKTLAIGLIDSFTFAGGMLSAFLMHQFASARGRDGGEYRLVAALSVLAALAFIPSIGFWVFPTMAVGLPLVLLLKVMLDPIQAKMQAMLQTAIHSNPLTNAEADNIFSFVSTFETLSAGVGGYFFGKVFANSGSGGVLEAHLGANAPLKVLTIALIVSAFVYLGSLPFLKKPRREVFEGRDFIARLETAKAALEESNDEQAEAEFKEALKRLSVARNPNDRINTIAAFVEEAQVAAARGSRAEAVQTIDRVLRLTKPNAAEKLARTHLEGARRAFSRRDIREFESEVSAVLDRLESSDIQDAKTKGLIDAAREIRLLAPRGRHTRAEVREKLDRAVTALSPIDETLALAKLKTYLKKMGLPAYTTEYDESPADDKKLVIGTVSQATLGKFGAIGQEVERQSPGSLHFILDPSWAIHETDHDGKARNYVTKALVYRAGKPVIVEYKHPRLIRFFTNFFTPGANDRDDGVPLERGLETPMSSSLQLDHFVDDKLLTRLPMAAKGIGVPATLALVMAAHPLARASTVIEGANPQRVEAMGAGRAEVKSSIEQFLRRYTGPEVVVKPSGPQFHSGRGVRIFSRDEIEAMTDHALMLRNDPAMTEDGAVLVERRVSPPPLYLRVTPYKGHGDFGFVDRQRVSVEIVPREEVERADEAQKARWRKDWNFRIWAARTPWDGAEATGLIARAGTWGKPTNANPEDPADNAVVLPFELVAKALRIQHGALQTPEEVEAFRADRLEKAERAFQAIIDEEAKRVRKDGEPYRAQTDMIGFDDMESFVGERSQGSVAGLGETFIEANSHDAGMQEEFDAFYSDRKGEHSRARVATMLARARREAMRGKRLVLIGAGSRMKRPFLERARDLGIKVVLVDNGLTGWARFVDWMRIKLGRKSRDNWARELASEFIAVDTTKPVSEATSEAVQALRRSQAKNGTLDGIYTYWEDNPVLTAHIAEALDLPYHTVATAETARSKSETRRATYHLSPVYFRKIRSRAELEAAVKEPDFPPLAVIKYDHGAAGHYNKEITRESALDDYDKIVADMKMSDDPIYLQGNEFVVEASIPGLEWDANVGLRGGRRVYGSVTDNTPVRKHVTDDGYNSMKGTGANLPSLQFSRGQQDQILDFVTECVRAIGATDGHFHVEGKTDESGRHWLLEINLRQGGSYVVSWNREVTGIDEIEMSFAMALGIDPVPYQSPRPLSYNVGRRLFTEKEGVVKRLELTQAAKDAGITALFEKKPGDKVDARENDRLVTLFVNRRTAKESARDLRLIEGDQSSLMLWVHFEVEPAPSKGAR